MHVHTIPVPDGMTPEEAFAEIRIFGELAEGRVVKEDGTGGCWAVIQCEASDDDCLGDDGWLTIVRRLLQHRRRR